MWWDIIKNMLRDIYFYHITDQRQYKAGNGDYWKGMVLQMKYTCIDI